MIILYTGKKVKAKIAFFRRAQVPCRKDPEPSAGVTAPNRFSFFRYSLTACFPENVSKKRKTEKILLRQSRNISATAAGGVLTGEFRRKKAGVSVRCMMFNQYHRAFLCCQCKTLQCSQMFYICPLRTVFSPILFRRCRGCSFLRFPPLLRRCGG